MSSYISIRGWVECDFDEVSTVKNSAIESWGVCDKYGLGRKAADLYWKGWSFPNAPINWRSYVFYGAVVNSQAYDFFKFVLSNIANLNADFDGVFYVDFEGLDDSRTLKIENGYLLDEHR
ncbi:MULTISPECIES: hypothetical protein [Pseudomonas]|uniref:hypothetical protein n=1 Tax=Pseudomonas TaxID=286 RepID=UPI001600DBE2|nr:MULTISPECIES: hypothetical protein [Pseudomonas]MDS9876016.1 hypothetical protein [Pseudomonas protegens]URN88748.1 MAG: hypothetical protein NAG77_28720 [Pseudomonas protegens]WEK26839.1 MAG: hypothetical protein P0Y61_10945 [Pseudomonas protegens]